MADDDEHDYRDERVTDLSEEVDDLEAALEAEIEALAGLYDQQEAHIAELEAEVASLRSGQHGDRRELSEQPDGTTETETHMEQEEETAPEPEPGDGAAVIVVSTDERPPKPRGWLWRSVGESRVPLDTERKKTAFWAKQSLF